MLASLIVVMPVLVAQLATPIPPAPQCRFERLGDPQRDEQAIDAFTVAVRQYAELHRRLARPMTPPQLWPDPEQPAIVAAALREVLRDARPHAAAGQIFTADLADVLRFRLRQAVIEYDYDVAAISIEEGDGEEGPAPLVIGEPPPHGSLRVLWPGLEDALPPLPAELAYAFVERDLVLLDVDADMVLDVLPLALPLR